HPDAEAELLVVARAASLRDLRDRCAQVAARGEGAEARHQRARRQRRCVDGTRSDGSGGLVASMSPVDGAVVAQALDVHQRVVFEAARDRAERDGFAAYRADALVRMARASLGLVDPADPADPAGADWGQTVLGGLGEAVVDDTGTDAPGPDPAGDASAGSAPGGGGPASVSIPGAATTTDDAPAHDSTPHDSTGPPGRSPGPRRRAPGRRRARAPRPIVVIRIDHTALWRGVTAGDEVCEIAGIGPVPVAHVADLIATGDPVIKAVVVTGRDITAMATIDRRTKADLRLAVLERDRRCQVPGCEVTFPLELDHHHPVAAGGPDTYTNLRFLCHHHHRQRTQGYDLVGPPGARRWLDPHGNTITTDPEPTAGNDTPDTTTSDSAANDTTPDSAAPHTAA
ncbi:MAG TPA: HNH endonuclease signature motif containing protein, partial [Acidimicrobiales bacterium]|nr:HNH endonuclease signature motif containing protein [Acidimicrobiales bacterium]